MIRTSFASLVLLSAAEVAFAQTASETIQVNLIEVPVSVLNAEGQPVRGLTAKNFELYDGRQKREITNFDVIDFAQPVAPTPAGEVPDAAVPGRQLMLLFDATNSAPSSLVRVRTAARDFVSNQLQSADRVAVARVSAREGFRLLSSFTTDRNLTLSAIETLGLPKQFAPRDPILLSAADSSSAPAPAPIEGDRRAAPGTPGEADVLEHLAAIANAQARLDKEGQRQLLTRQMQALTEIGRSLDRIRGRKHVVLLSEGFDAKLLQGGAGTTTARAEDRQAVESGEIWKVDTDNQYGSVESAGDLRRLVDALRRSDVVLHAIDIKGVRTDVDTRDGVRPADTVESLHLLTRDSGGTVFRNTNDLTTNFARMLKQDEVMYVLAFRASTSGPGKFHDLKVRLVDVPNARVFHRAGYYEPSPSLTENERTLSAGDIIMNNRPVEELKVASLATAIPRKSGNALVPVVLEVDGDSILKTTREKTARLEFFIYAFDTEGVIRDFAYQFAVLDIGKLRSKLDARGVKFFNTLQLSSGEYSVRVLVRSGLKNGFTSVSLRVPAPGERFVTQPFIFDASTDWVMIKSPDREAGAKYPFQVSEDLFVPAVHPSVVRGSAVQIAIFAANMQPGALRLAAIAQHGDAVTRLPVKFLGRAPDPELVKLVYEVQTTELGVGKYSLMLEVVDGAVTRRTFVPLTAN